MVSSRSSLNLHSQIVAVLQPSCCMEDRQRTSRSTFLANFCSHFSLLVFGVVANLQPLWRCQKQPCTNIAAPYLGRTRSGWQGISGRRRSEKRNPLACKCFLTRSSGFVFRERMPDIIRERSSFETISAIFTLVVSRGPGMKLR